MGIVTTGIISFAVTLFDLGLRDDFVQLGQVVGLRLPDRHPGAADRGAAVQGVVDRMFARAV
jgi:hypothetical protein